jgi:ectoine hydroxylase-related dioxygenase (phytanoyl-CoA dioxygenase family)
MKLTGAQFKEFDERGFLRLPSLHSSDAIQALIQRVRNIMAGRIQYEGMFFQLESNRETTTFQGPSSDYRKIKDLEYDPLFLDFIQHRAFSQMAARYIGPEVSCMRAMVMNKPASSQSVVPWHQDISEDWAMSRPPAFTIWTALDPATVDNGCLRVVVGSHQKDKIGTGHNLSEVDLETFVEQGEVEYIELAPGESIIFHNALLHGSGPNATDRSRLAMTICLMDAATQHTRTGKHYPVVFGKHALTQVSIRNLNAIPSHVYD